MLYVDSAEKAARFVMNCNQDWLPILFLQDVNGFMVGRDAERSGIIKAGAKLVSAISNSRVPKITRASPAAPTVPATTRCAAKRSTRDSSSPGRRPTAP